MTSPSRWRDREPLRTLAALAFVLLAACASDSDTGGEDGAPEAEQTAACESAAQAVTDSVAEGLTVSGGGSLEGGQMIDIPADKRNDRGFPAAFFAARIVGERLPEDAVGVWAVGDKASGGGPIWALDNVAQEFSEWLADAEEGSPADENRDTLADYPEATKVERCFE